MATGKKVEVTKTVLTLELEPLEVQILSDLLFLADIDFDNRSRDEEADTIYRDANARLATALYELGARMGLGRIICASPNTVQLGDSVYVNALSSIKTRYNHEEN